MTRRWIIVAVVLQGLTLSCDSSSPTAPKPNAVAPGSASLTAPSGLTTKAVSWNEIDLSWPKPSNPATGSEIFRSNAGGGGTYSLLARVDASVSTYADAALSGSTQYCYEARTYKMAGKNAQYSAFSSAVCATTLAPPVTAPSQVDAVPTGSASVAISWADNSSNEDGFRIERADAIGGPWTQVATAAANATLISQPVTAEKVACFRVIAFNSSSSSSPSTADCTTSPAAPTTLKLTNLGQASVQLAWQDNSAVEDGYTLSRFQPLTGWQSVAKLGANANTFTDTRVVASQKYTYRVFATKDGGSSDYSNELTVTLPDQSQTIPPAAPTTLDVIYFADNQYGWLYFGASWTDASVNEDGFRIEVSDDGVSGWKTFGTTGANEAGFSLQLSLWDNLAPLSQCFRVIAFSGGLDSKSSNVACTDWNRPPTNLTATAVDQQSIDLSWTDNAYFELGYFIYRSTTVDGDYEFVGSGPANTTTYRDSGLASGQEYWYVVILNRDNEGGDVFDYSDRVSATTLSAAPLVVGSGALRLGSTPSKIVKRSPHDRPIVRGTPSIRKRLPVGQTH